MVSTFPRIIPDLTINNYSAPDVAELGGVISVNYTLTNPVPSRMIKSGWLSIPYLSIVDPSTTKFYLSQDATLDSSDINLGAVNEPLIGGLQSYKRVDLPLTLPSNISTGNYYLIYEVDSEKKIAETDENNNIAAKPISITLPNLAISDSTAPDIVSSGGKYTVSFTETNQSLLPTKAYQTNIYISKDGVIDSSDLLLSASAQQSLGANASRAFSQEITIPNNLDAGSYYLLYQSDSNNSVRELNEGDNVRAEAIEINSVQRNQFNLNFATTGQSVLKPGSQIVFSDNRFLGAEWNISDEKSVSLLGKSLGVRGSSQGKVGLQSNLQINGGGLNASLPINFWLDLPKKVKSGDIITIKSGFSLDKSASFSTTSPNASYSLDGMFKLNASAQAFLGGSNLNLFSAGFDGKANLVNLNSNQIDYKYKLGSYGKFDLRSPNINTSDNANDGVLATQVSDNFLQSSLNVDKILTDVLRAVGVPVPNMQGSFSFSPAPLTKVSASYNILDLDLNANLSLKQNLGLSADNLTGQLTLENGQSYNFKVGDDLTLTVPDGIGDSLDFTASLNLGANLSNKTSLGYDVNSYLRALEGSVKGEISQKISYPDIEWRKGSWGIRYPVVVWKEKEISLGSASAGLGPLINRSDKLLNGDISLYENNFALGGLNTQNVNFNIPAVI